MLCNHHSRTDKINDSDNYDDIILDIINEDINKYPEKIRNIYDKDNIKYVFEYIINGITNSKHIEYEELYRKIMKIINKDKYKKLKELSREIDYYSNL